MKALKATITAGLLFTSCAPNIEQGVPAQTTINTAELEVASESRSFSRSRTESTSRRISKLALLETIISNSDRLEIVGAESSAKTLHIAKSRDIADHGENKFCVGEFAEFNSYGKITIAFTQAGISTQMKIDGSGQTLVHVDNFLHGSDSELSALSDGTANEIETMLSLVCDTRVYPVAE